MTENKKVIRIFLSYAFTPKQKAYSQKEIQKVVRESITIAKRKLGKMARNITIEPDFELTEYGGILKAELLSKISAADISIVDISDNNPNVFYELGFIDANKKPAIIMKSTKASDRYRVPSDISDRFYMQYDSISDVRDKLAESLKKRIEELLNISQLSLSSLRNLWFPENTAVINVVGPPSQTKTEFSEVRSQNYVYLDRLGDKDAMLEIMILLSRLYPSARINKFMANDFPQQSHDENLVIVGGPGTNEEPSNSLCRTISDKTGSKVSYIGFEKMKVGKKIFVAEYDKNKQVTTDYGYFARMPNPLNPRSTVIMVHGIHTYGVLGASRSFSDHHLAVKNVQKIIDELGLNPYFESWFRVDVLNGVVKIPEIEDFRRT